MRKPTQRTVNEVATLSIVGALYGAIALAILAPPAAIAYAVYRALGKKAPTS